MSFNKDKQRWSRYLSPLVVGLALSLFSHFFFIAYELHKRNEETAAIVPAPIEITEVPKEYLEPPRPAKKQKPAPAISKESQMAETEDANNRDVDDKAKFLSDHNQKAERQQKAKLVDDFRKKTGTGLKNQNKQVAVQPPPTSGENGSDSSVPVPGEGEAAKKKPGESGVKRDWKTLSLKDLSLGGDGGATAATDDKLDGVDRGERTILSTREYKFFSYYQRIKELLRQYWKPNVERKLAKLYRVGKTVQEDELVTKILVLLDEKGNIQKISRVSGSGIADVDEAAVEAFQKAGPFPNPPRGIMDPDGFARIRWDFILTVESAPRIQFSSAGAGPGGPY